MKQTNECPDATVNTFETSNRCAAGAEPQRYPRESTFWREIFLLT